MRKILSLALICATVILSSCKSEETPNDIIDVTGVTLNPTTLSIEVGKTATITATITPADATDKSVTWKSSDPGVATVEKGVVTALKDGNTTITATTNDGGKEAKCEVTVGGSIINVTGITIAPETLSIEIGKTGTITTTIAPADATDKTLTWTSNDPTIASVENGVVTGVKAGEAIITAKTTDGGKEATCKVTVVSLPQRGDFYYKDGTYSSEFKGTTENPCVGIIFFIQPDNAKKGRIVSLDETFLVWSDAKTWKSSAELPEGMSWSTPESYDLQYLYCAFAGLEPSLWDDSAPTEVEGAKDAFNAKLKAAGGTELSKELMYWSSSEMTGNSNKAWFIAFNSGLKATAEKNVYMKTRSVVYF